MDDLDRKALQEAKRRLDHPGLAMRLAGYLGRPVELGLEKLPARANELVLATTRGALEKALAVAVRSLGDGPRAAPGDWRHRLAVIGTGAAGGFFGLAALPLELPVTTTLMLRSVADHARSQGEDLSTLEARLQCLAVFALGGKPGADDATDVGYFAVRLALARAVSQAAEYLASRSAAEVATDAAVPVIARLIASVTARFGPVVAEKIAAQAAPVAGAVGGAVINTLFINHYQDMAWGHFTVRRLERSHGADEVRRTWEALPDLP
jgi:hypothetical protein